MAELGKLLEHDIMPLIKHNMRHLSDGRHGKNKSIQPEITPENKNYTIVSRGDTCREINKYRQEMEKKIHIYKRKNIVKCIEFVVQKPDDLPPEQTCEFFQACHVFFVQKYLAGHEEFVFVSQVHIDERFTPSYTKQIKKPLSHDHLHIMAIPAVPTQKFAKEGFEFKLSAHDLTSRKMLYSLHPELQEFLKQRHISGSVMKKTGDGKVVGFTIEQLKELTNSYGITLDHSVTVDEFAKIVSEKTTISQQSQLINSGLFQQKNLLQELQNSLSSRVQNLEKNYDLMESQQKTVDVWGNQSVWWKEREVEKTW